MVQDLNRTFMFARTIAFGIASLFAFISLAMAAAVTQFTSKYYDGFYSFAALAIVTSVLTLATLPVLWFLSSFRKSAITSIVAVELGWTSFLWILWLSTGASTADAPWLGSCRSFYYNVGERMWERMCSETQALTAFSFLTWITLLVYSVTLLVLVIRQHSRGNLNVWTNYIAETDFAAPPTANAGTHAEPKIAPSAENSPVVGGQYYPPQNHQMAPQPVYQQTTSPYPQV
ncbi:hypothetical protein D9619_001202 [Psilocybe cf. subviscida]|uniref:MARVEL domain-containing protein n=1 Tax=Psilocybe cf. subviscida TaxID=2480587 RepID=A0A8H5BCJ7_9AGAR|nr:hypothetical protein D9619_001202 [Psilocybe cf. subviscida]